MFTINLTLIEKHGIITPWIIYKLIRNLRIGCTDACFTKQIREQSNKEEKESNS